MANGLRHGPDPDAVFAQCLRVAREMAGLTQQQLADAMSAAGYPMRQNTISTIEAGTRKVWLGEAMFLAGFVGMTLGDLLVPPPDERLHDARVRAQLKVRSLHRELMFIERERDKQNTALEVKAGELRAARQELRDLGGELPFDTPDVPPGVPPDVFDPPRRR